MGLTVAQKKVISNIFRDLTKLTVAALVLGQFVPGRSFDPLGFLGGLVASFFLGVVAVFSAAQEEEK